MILVHAGLYQADRFRYAGQLGLLFDGTYRFRQGGTADKPIVIKAAGDGEVIFDGGGNHMLFDVMAADHLYFEGLTLRNTEVAIQAGYKGLAGAEGLVVKRMRFEDVGRGIYTDGSGSRNFYIADNIFIGRSHPERLEGWIGRVWQGTPGFPTPVHSELAVKVYGAGHVIAHNFIRNLVYHAPEGGVSNQHSRNNLVLGQGAADPVMAVQTYTAWSSSDYNGFRLNPGAATHFVWSGPGEGVAASYDAATLLARESGSLEAHRAATGQEQHSVLLDYDVFVNVPPLDTSEPWLLHDPAAVDFRLRPGSAAVDAGVVLPGINDGFSGAAPDLGALELGQPLPYYGPRP